MNEKFKHMKIKYDFHVIVVVITGVIIATKKFQIQIPNPVARDAPAARISNGRISGTYTYGTLRHVMPNIRLH